MKGGDVYSLHQLIYFGVAVDDLFDPRLSLVIVGPLADQVGHGVALDPQRRLIGYVARRIALRLLDAVDQGPGGLPVDINQKGGVVHKASGARSGADMRDRCKDGMIGSFQW